MCGLQSWFQMQQTIVSELTGRSRHGPLLVAEGLRHEPQRVAPTRVLDGSADGVANLLAQVAGCGRLLRAGLLAWAHGVAVAGMSNVHTCCCRALVTRPCARAHARTHAHICTRTTDTRRIRPQSRFALSPAACRRSAPGRCRPSARPPRLRTCLGAQVAMHIMGQADHASPSATFIPRDWPNSLTGGQVSAVRSTTLARSMCAMMRLPPAAGKLVWHCASRHRTPRSVGAVRGVENSGDGVAAVEAADQRCGFLHVLGRVAAAVGLIDEVPGQHRRMVLVLFHLGHVERHPVSQAGRLGNDMRRRCCPVIGLPAPWGT